MMYENYVNPILLRLLLFGARCTQTGWTCRRVRFSEVAEEEHRRAGRASPARRRILSAPRPCSQGADGDGHGEAGVPAEERAEQRGQHDQLPLLCRALSDTPVPGVPAAGPPRPDRLRRRGSVGADHAVRRVRLPAGVYPGGQHGLGRVVGHPGARRAHPGAGRRRRRNGHGHGAAPWGSGRPGGRRAERRSWCARVRSGGLRVTWRGGRWCGRTDAARAEGPGVGVAGDGAGRRVASQPHPGADGVGGAQFGLAAGAGHGGQAGGQGLDAAGGQLGAVAPDPLAAHPVDLVGLLPVRVLGVGVMRAPRAGRWAGRGRPAGAGWRDQRPSTSW